MVNVTVAMLDGGWWTYDVPAARIHLVAKFHRGTPYFAAGTTQEGQTVWIHERAGIVRLEFPESGACFTFPATSPHRRRIDGVAYERACDSGQRYWARAQRGRLCR